MNKPSPVSKTISTRRKWITGMGILSVLAIWKMNFFSKKNPAIDCAPPGNKKTIKVLSQDGKLVEVDASQITMIKQKISDKELQEWVKKS